RAVQQGHFAKDDEEMSRFFTSQDVMHRRPLKVMIPNQVYHLVEAANWPSVQRHGLLSTLELLRLTGISPAARQQISTTQRLRRTALSDQVAIRDQVPMPADALQKCLIGMTPAQWYSLLNGMVFF